MPSKAAQPRQPKGTPVGGEFAAKQNPESDLELGDLLGSEFVPEVGSFVERRVRSLEANGYVLAATTPNVVNPRSTAHRKEWWDAQMAAGEYGVQGGSYAQMPDDWTPSSTMGHAISGFRRTHRMSYVGSGVALRMPSVASIKSFSKSTVPGKAPGETFDLPVSAQFPGGEVSGWVRVSVGKDGTWATQGLGFTPEQSAYVAESVQCVLESRRPSRALGEVGDLLERRRRRAAEMGAVVQDVKSTWIKSAGYDRATGTMVMRTDSKSGPRSYGFKVPPSVYQAVVEAPKPGVVFNHSIRGRAQSVSVAECPQCGRFTADGGSHRCPPQPSQRHAVVYRSTLVQDHLRRMT